MRIAVTGSSGLIGRSVCTLLNERGHTPVSLVRRRPCGPGDIFWDPATGAIDAPRLGGLDAVIHLAGKNIGSGRWTRSRKAAIYDSRVNGTRLLCDGLRRAPGKPRVLIAASAIGFYGDRGHEILDETSARGTGFLAALTEAWENATTPAREAGIRVVNLRFGVVLSSRGGALARMLTPFRLGLGGSLGSGDQVVSWISLRDAARCIHHVLSNEAIEGPINAVAPNPVTNRVLSDTLARLLGRPALLPVPEFIVRLAFGEMGRELLLASAYVRSTRLGPSGFEWADTEVAAALRAALRGQ